MENQTINPIPNIFPINQTELRELKWGTSKAMQIRDPLGRIQPVGAYGEFSLKISKPELLTGILANQSF